MRKREGERRRRRERERERERERDAPGWKGSAKGSKGYGGAGLLGRTRAASTAAREREAATRADMVSRGSVRSGTPAKSMSTPCRRGAHRAV